MASSVRTIPGEEPAQCNPRLTSMSLLQLYLHQEHMQHLVSVPALFLVKYHHLRQVDIRTLEKAGKLKERACCKLIQLWHIQLRRHQIRQVDIREFEIARELKERACFKLKERVYCMGIM